MTMLAKNDSLLKTTLKTTALCLLPMLFYTQNAQAEGKLTIYCSVQNVTCEKVTKRFAEKYNVDAQFVRNSTGTVLGKIKAEKENPQAEKKPHTRTVLRRMDTVPAFSYQRFQSRHCRRT